MAWPFRIWAKVLCAVRRRFRRPPAKEAGRVAAHIRVRSAMLSDRGGREDNEDDAGIMEPRDPREAAAKGNLYVVADGVGGRAAGEVASRAAVEIICNEYFNNPVRDVEAALRSAVLAANRRIFEMASEGERQGMGTTCACAVLRGRELFLAHAGDSRVYLVHDGHMTQLTEDHSLVAEQVKIGALTSEQAQTSPYRNVITRCLGINADVEIETGKGEVVPGDILVLCTDGLYNQVAQEHLVWLVLSLEPEEACQRLVRLANKGDGSDNITLIVAKVEGVGKG